MNFKLLSIIMALLIFNIPYLTLAQQATNGAQAVVDAKSDIKEPLGWLAGGFLMASGLGCLGGSLVILASQAMTPSPPAHRFLGKSPEYISIYTNTYQSEMRSKRLIYSSAGCLGGTIVAAIVWSNVYTSY